MNRALIGVSGRKGALQMGLPLLLELGMRVFRIPLFPGVAPLLGESPVAVRLGYAAVLCGVEVAFLGSGGWELVVASGIAASLVGRRLRFLRFTLAAAGVWVMLGVATRSLGGGSFGLETLLTAVLVRVTGSEVLAAAAARVVLAALVYVSVLSMGLVTRPLRRLVPATVALLSLVNACADKESTAFRPDGVGREEMVRVDYGEAVLGRRGHPIVPGDAHDNGRCLSCHRGKVGPTDLPLAQEGFHEIHYEVVRVAAPCTSCHAGAGRPGFPGEYPQQGARHAYNQTCAGCHSGADGPRWARSMR